MGRAMNVEELKNSLQDITIPELEEQVRDRILKKALNRYQQVQTAPESAQKFVFTGSLFGSGLITAIALTICVVAFVMNTIMLPANNPTIKQPDYVSLNYNLAVFKEYQNLFQQDLKALVVHNGDIDVLHDANEQAQVNPLVFIEISKNDKQTFITAFSGQEVEVMLDNRPLTIAVLVTANSQVILSSEEFVLDGHDVYGPEDLFAKAHIVGVKA